MYEHNALCYWSGLALCLTKVRSSRARCPATALIIVERVLQPTDLTTYLSRNVCRYTREYTCKCTD